MKGRTTLGTVFFVWLFSWRERCMVTINGEPVAAEGQSIADYLASVGYTVERVAVELNGAILPKTAYSQTVLSAGDEVEIVAFVGGG